MQFLTRQLNLLRIALEWFSHKAIVQWCTMVEVQEMLDWRRGRERERERERIMQHGVIDTTCDICCVRVYVCRMCVNK